MLDAHNESLAIEHLCRVDLDGVTLGRADQAHEERDCSGPGEAAQRLCPTASAALFAREPRYRECGRLPDLPDGWLVSIDEELTSLCLSFSVSSCTGHVFSVVISATRGPIAFARIIWWHASSALVPCCAIRPSSSAAACGEKPSTVSEARSRIRVDSPARRRGQGRVRDSLLGLRIAFGQQGHDRLDGAGACELVA